MDKIILHTQDVETLLKWRDNNKDLIRRNPAPFKAIMLEFPDTSVIIQAYNDAGKISFYLQVNGERAGKITGRQLAGGLLQVKKNTTKLKSDDVQSIITVYASLMAFIVYNEPGAAAAAAKKTRQERPKKRKSGAQRSKNGITYLFKHSSSGPRLQRRGQHASPAAAFTVRGHYRRYKDGKTVWIAPYTKGSGSSKGKTYKLN
jgi:hypothetical protein